MIRKFYGPDIIKTSEFDIEDDGFDTRKGDKLRIYIPNDSNTTQSLRRAELTLSLIEMKDETEAPAHKPPPVAHVGFGSSTGNITFTPHNIEAGDRVYAVAAQGATSDSITPPTAGWTRYTSNSTPLQNTRMEFWWKELEATDILANWTWGFASTGHGNQVVCAVAKGPSGHSLHTITGTQTGGLGNNPISMPSYTNPPLGANVLGFAAARTSSSVVLSHIQGEDWTNGHIGSKVGWGHQFHPAGLGTNLSAQAVFTGIIQKKTWRVVVL